jgi:AraC-like DNA-binding protein
MSDTPVPLLPAGALRGLLAGFDDMGLDGRTIRAAVTAACQGAALPDAFDATVPVGAYLAAWEAAERQHPAPGLPTRAAAGIPFGAFGIVDYLCGSADNVGGGCESLALHYRLVSNDTRLDVEALDDGRLLRVVPLTDHPPRVTEFVLAVLVFRLRRLTGGAFAPRRVLLVNPVPDPPHAFDALFGAPAFCAQPYAALDVDARTWSLPIVQADPFLHRTLTELAASLQLRGAGDGGGATLESAMRARLRHALPAQQAEVADLARLLGVSERTLQRRLAEAGRSFAAVVEDFRRDEAARLLADPQRPLVHVAAALGYREQTSFTRAFRRWTGSTPAAWRASRAVRVNPASAGRAS